MEFELAKWCLVIFGIGFFHTQLMHGENQVKVYSLRSNFQAVSETDCYLNDDELKSAQLKWNASTGRFSFTVPANRPSSSWHFGISPETVFGDHLKGAWGGWQNRYLVPLNYVLL